MRSPSPIATYFFISLIPAWIPQAYSTPIGTLNQGNSLRMDTSPSSHQLDAADGRDFHIHEEQTDNVLLNHAPLRKREPESDKPEQGQIVLDPSKIYISLPDIPSVWRSLTVSSLASLTPFGRFYKFDLKDILAKSKAYTEDPNVSNSTQQVLDISRFSDLDDVPSTETASSDDPEPSSWVETANSLQNFLGHVDQRTWRDTTFGKTLDTEHKGSSLNETRIFVIVPRAVSAVAAIPDLVQQLSSNVQHAVRTRSKPRFRRKKKYIPRPAWNAEPDQGERSKMWINWNGYNWKMFSGVRRAWYKAKVAVHNGSQRLRPGGGRGQIWR